MRLGAGREKVDWTCKKLFSSLSDDTLTIDNLMALLKGNQHLAENVPVRIGKSGSENGSTGKCKQVMIAG